MKGKSLSDRIAERIQSKAKEASAPQRNLAIVIALREEIIKAINDGWPIKTIWDQLHAEGKIEFSYQTFRKNVLRLTKQNKKVDEKKAVEAGPGRQEDKKGEQPKQQINGFAFDPTPKKEDLI